MICAVYARKSNEQEKGASGATDSCERQIEHAKAFAASRGWTIEPELIYVDDQISGAEISKLKARARIVADADAGKFLILVISEQKSLGRGKIIETRSRARHGWESSRTGHRDGSTSRGFRSVDV